jgi:tRNA dimethylallyltransferase
MINDGLLDEVCNIYNPNATYTQGLRQAIGVREFDEFFRLYGAKKEPDEITTGSSTSMVDLHDDKMKSLLNEAVSQLKANTRRLVRRQVSTIIPVYLYSFILSEDNLRKLSVLDCKSLS